jgi:hypothetical protein
MGKNLEKKLKNAADESGMIMVESVLCLTMFAIFIMTIIYMVDAILLQTKLQTALDKAAKEISVYGYVESNGAGTGAYAISYQNNQLYGDSIQKYGSEVKPVVNAFIYGNSLSGVARVVYKYLAENEDVTYLSYMGLKNGYTGLDFSGCSYDVNNDDLILQLSYRVNIFRSNFFSNLGGTKTVVLTATTKFWKE